MKHYSPRCILNLVLRLIDLKSVNDPHLVNNLPFRLDNEFITLVIQEYDKDQLLDYSPGRNTTRLYKFVDIKIAIIDNKKNTHSNVCSLGYHNNKIYIFLFLIGYWCEYLEELVIKAEKDQYNDAMDKKYFLGKLNSLIEEEKESAIEKSHKVALYLGDDVI